MKRRDLLPAIRSVFLPAFALALSACATGGIYGSGPQAGAVGGAETETQAEGAGPGSQARPGANATASLVAQSRAERNDGDYGGATATIERALTIAPEDAGLWMELAEIHMEQGDWDVAEEMARKALTLTADDTIVAERARRILDRQGR